MCGKRDFAMAFEVVQIAVVFVVPGVDTAGAEADDASLVALEYFPSDSLWPKVAMRAHRLLEERMLWLPWLIEHGTVDPAFAAALDARVAERATRSRDIRAR